MTASLDGFVIKTPPPAATSTTLVLLCLGLPSQYRLLRECRASLSTTNTTTYRAVASRLCDLVIPPAIAASQRSPPVIARTTATRLSYSAIPPRTTAFSHSQRTIAVQGKLIEAAAIASRNFRAGRDSPA
ncbi:hypothetical protein B0H14DRAFT_3430927 [Mycena olivaceomarginata]|nr:hypothetical protein B0H14DRAFT_3430927 [Mycena olivaceomarginata]